MLKDIVARAEEKEKTMKLILEKANVPHLEV